MAMSGDLDKSPLLFNFVKYSNLGDSSQITPPEITSFEK